MKIELTAEEETLLSTIEFEALKLESGQPARDNAERAAQLATFLIDRKAIPEIREKVYSDEGYTTGHGPSAAEQFRRHDNTHEETIRHPHFLPWLRYFIFGPKLPETMIREFEILLSELGSLTSGDGPALKNFIRNQIKHHRLEKSKSDEVYKLILEFKDDTYLAKSLRAHARTISGSLQA